MRRPAVVLGVVAVLAVVAFAAVRAMHPNESGLPTAVDVGFAQDMLVHHRQAIVMAAYTEQHAESPKVQQLAAAINSDQQRESGQMVGWLQSWGRPTQSDRVPMAWMASGMTHGEHSGDPQSMPGMASLAEMDALVNLTGARLDRQFLTLMIRHHEGGLPMAKDAATRAGTAYVRDTARVMIQDQQSEIDYMQVLLADLR